MESKFIILLALILSPALRINAQEVAPADEDLQAMINGSDSKSKKTTTETEVSTKTDTSSDTVEVVPPEEKSLDEKVPEEKQELTDSLEPEAPLDEALPPVEGESEDAKIVKEDAGEFVPATTDELDALKKDTKDDKITPEIEESKTDIAADEISKETPKIAEQPAIFDVGVEERNLMSLAENIQGQIPDNEWSEVATASKVDSYTVVKNDWLFKISKKIFGSGYYYPKIWSLNSYITNPHFIEPGMLLSFSTGSSNQAPEVKLGSFSTDELASVPGSTGNGNATDLSNFGDDVKPKWLDEKDGLSKQGIYFQYASEETADDLTEMGAQALNREYEGYEPPKSDFDVVVPSTYDKLGFDKSSRIYYSFKEGYYLSTFVSTNIVQDFGSISDGPDENILFTKLDTAYVQFDESINAMPGDKFSVYSSSGKVKHQNSDREGYEYTIVGQIKLIRKIKDKWEVEFIEVAGTPQRGDRITTYTPKIDRITHSYNSRLIEAAIMSSVNKTQSYLSTGSVVYLDRGRADGVEMGNVFEVFGFKDRLTGKNITDQPTYKIGELTVITLTDNFATALITKSRRDMRPGDIAITKTKEVYLREQNALKGKSDRVKQKLGGKELEELDVELNLENLNDNLLKEADKIQLTEDELAELERQEREKSVIKDSERDLKSLERLENEIEQAESILNDAKVDEDKLLENENLNEIEKKNGSVDQDSIEEIEENLGKRYIDEDINSKDNPFGLTEFDVEEVDELLNTEKKTNNK